MEKIKLRLPLKDIFITQPYWVNYLDFYKQMWLPYHPGVDFRARNSCKLYTAGDGTVVNVGKYSDGWIGIEIRHNNGYSTFYYHLKEYYVKIGDEVKAGDLIGLCDNTGKYTTGDHLHFELRLNWEKINPAWYFNYAYDWFPIGSAQWDKSRCYHRYYRVAKRDLKNEMKVALYMATRLKRLPNNEEINMAIWWGWAMEDIMNPAMYEITSQVTKWEFINQKQIPFN
jgi:murein DD-endopeptidase MepM/ murein hydrolase activator NlpD